MKGQNTERSFAPKKGKTLKFVAGAMTGLLVMVTGCASGVGQFKVGEVFPSPTDAYQACVVLDSGGATAGNSYLYVECADDVNVFSKEGDCKGRNGIQIEGTRSRYNASHEVDWTSDHSFDVILDHAKGISVEMKGNEYSTKEWLVLDKGKSTFDSFEIEGDQVLFHCKLAVENTTDHPLQFSTAAKSFNDDGKLLSNSKLTSEDENGEMIYYEIAPDTSELVDVVLRGEKGPEDTKADRNLPGVITLDILFDSEK